jgi:hypothetical protein
MCVSGKQFAQQAMQFVWRRQQSLASVSGCCFTLKYRQVRTRRQSLRENM